MEWAIKEGGWTATRWVATDSSNPQNSFIAISRFWQVASRLPGLHLYEENEPDRATSRAELACLSSWQNLIEDLRAKDSPSGWFLLMEDDAGSSLACPHKWPFNFNQITSAVGENALAIQMAPISSHARLKLHAIWEQSNGLNIAVPKTSIRSHGNGAVLLNYRAVPLLERRIGRWIQKYSSKVHLLSHPSGVRPVADKWLYACLPASSSWVCTYPLFCLEANDSNLHSEHVQNFHVPSRETTLNIWKENNAIDLINSFSSWMAQEIKS